MFAGTQRPRKLWSSTRASSGKASPRRRKIWNCSRPGALPSRNVAGFTACLRRLSTSIVTVDFHEQRNPFAVFRAKHYYLLGAQDRSGGASQRLFTDAARRTRQLELDMSGLLRGDPETRWKIARNRSAEPRADAERNRRVEGWNPRPGGDEVLARHLPRARRLRTRPRMYRRVRSRRG